MTLVRALRLFVAVVLLSAQHAALTHQVWHLGDDATQPAQSRLCGQHHALDTASGVLDCPSPMVAAVASVDTLGALVAVATATVAGPSPSSRGPPARL